jgi:hypothetical protein
VLPRQAGRKNSLCYQQPRKSPKAVGSTSFGDLVVVRCAMIGINQFDIGFHVSRPLLALVENTELEMYMLTVP